MATTIHVHQVKSALENDTHQIVYRLVTTFSAATSDLPNEVILLKKNDITGTSYARICSVADIKAYDTDVPTVDTYYRVATFTVDFGVIDAAIEAANDQIDKAKMLVEDWETSGRSSFFTTVDETISSEP